MSSGACPLCLSRESRTLHEGLTDRLGLSPEPFSTRLCARCGSVRLARLPSQEELTALYPEGYTARETSRGGALRRWVSAVEMRLYYDRMYRLQSRSFRRLTGLAGGRVLDVGCGSGQRMAALSRMGFRVEGSDTSRADVEYARERFGLPAHHGVLEALPFAPESFDAVTLYNVLEHLPDPAGTLQAVRRILRPGGQVCVMVPVMDGLQARLFGRRWIEIREMPRHTFIPTTGGMAELLGRCGFEDLRSVPAEVFSLAHVMAESLVPGAVGSAASGSGALGGFLSRAAGALALLPCLPAAAAERFSGSASTKVFRGRKGGGGP